MSKHTNGPWKVGTGWIYQATPSGKPGRRICRIEVTPEDDANANLIAASPHMLSVIKGLLSVIHKSSWAHVENATANDPCGCKECQIANAQAVIAKAEPGKVTNA